MDFKKDDDEIVSPFQGIQKTAVFQDARVFHEAPISPKKCIPILTKILYLIYQGEKIGHNEAIECFFAITKLFQSNDIALRRMVYLVIKELPVPPEDIIIVNSCLTKDMNGKNGLYKASAIRVLCGVMDASMLGQSERHLKEAIVDKNTAVSSATLISAIHLMKSNADIVKRWVSEVQEALNSSSAMVQYHALGLLFKIKQHDRLAVSRLVASLTRGSSLRSPHAHCLLIRIASSIMQDEAKIDPQLFQYLEVCLRHKSEMVIYEAARAICNLKAATSRELTPAITVLQLFLGSHKATLRFAAVRTLNQVAMKHPMQVTSCNIDLENLIADSNRSIATLAITTLLKTGTENAVDRLMRQISEFMSEIPDEFKIVVVDAIRSLCLKYPQKNRVLMSFLSNVLREEGGFEFKRTIVETIVDLIDIMPDARSVGLDHLCEFIEDCEFPSLAVKILHLLGEEGPKTDNPSKYIRYIFNRVGLENAAVRASAVAALGNIGSTVPELRAQILVLLQRCLLDTDDEVRERVAMFTEILSRPEEDEEATSLLDPPDLDLEALQQSLLEYGKAGATEQAFDIDTVPVQVVSVQAAPQQRAAEPGARPPQQRPGAQPSPYEGTLSKIPQFAKLGKVFKSSKPMELTEEETEYVVNVVKHAFPGHIVFQFNITNTLNDQILCNAVVRLEQVKEDAEESDVAVIGVVEAKELRYDVPGQCFACVRLPEDDPFATPTFRAVLKFIVKDCDPATGEPDDEGYDDEYAIEDVEVMTSDYMQGMFVPNFAEGWEKLGTDNEVVEIFSLTSMRKISDAVEGVLDVLGMTVGENTDDIKPDATSHTLLLAGMFAGRVPSLVRSRLKLDQTGSVTMELTVRSTDEDVSALISQAVG